MARRNIVVRQATASLYESARQRALDIAQEICDEVATSPDTPEGATHRLRNSYYVDADASGDALIKSRVPYWKFVEFGTGHGQAQPHLRPAIEAVRTRNR